MEYISSKENSTVKKWCSLITSSAERYENGLFCVEGAKMCAEAATADIRVSETFFTESAKEKYSDAFCSLTECCERVYVISDAVSAKMSNAKTSQGVFALCEMPEMPTVSRILDCGGNVIVLDSLSDPGNLGTIFRTAEAFGITGVILCENCVDPYLPKVVRSTMGSVFRIPFTIENNLSALKDAFASHGVKLYSSELDKTAYCLDETSFCKSVGVVIGNESNGVSSAMSRLCDGKIYIPMQGRNESLNASVAAAILMWEMRHR